MRWRLELWPLQVRDNQELWTRLRVWSRAMARFGQPRAFLLSHCLATLGLSAVSTTEGLPLCRSHTVRRVLTEDESRPRQPRTLTAIALEEWEWRVLIRFADRFV
jgi:hypothetical protein